MIGSDATVVSRALDKDAEYEADCIAVVLATCAGYDAYGLQRCCNNPVILQKTKVMAHCRLKHIRIQITVWVNWIQYG